MKNGEKKTFVVKEDEAGLNQVRALAMHDLQEIAVLLF